MLCRLSADPTQDTCATVDHANYKAATGQHEVDHTDEEYRCPEIFRPLSGDRWSVGSVQFKPVSYSYHIYTGAQAISSLVSHQTQKENDVENHTSRLKGILLIVSFTVCKCSPLSYHTKLEKKPTSITREPYRMLKTRCQKLKTESSQRLFNLLL